MLGRGCTTWRGDAARRGVWRMVVVALVILAGGLAGRHLSLEIGDGRGKFLVLAQQLRNHLLVHQVGHGGWAIGSAARPRHVCGPRRGDCGGPRFGGTLLVRGLLRTAIGPWQELELVTGAGAPAATALRPHRDPRYPIYPSFV